LSSTFFFFHRSWHVVVWCAGLVKHWAALELWQGPGGFQRLERLAAEAIVQIMISSSAQFAGDMQSMRLLEAPFSAFLDGTLRLPQEAQSRDLISENSQFYLAQAPIILEDGRPGPLHALMQDIEVPHLLQDVPLSQVNLWASLKHTESTLHYDPHCNLLCIVSGRKCVWTAPPEARKTLAANPIWHESCNHAGGNLCSFSEGVLQSIGGGKFTLHAGDALYIPEGYYHQVVSDAGTLGVNFWWTSRRVAGFEGAPSEGYLMRRLAQSLMEKRRHDMVQEVCFTASNFLATSLGEQVEQQSIQREYRDALQRYRAPSFLGFEQCSELEIVIGSALLSLTAHLQSLPTSSHAGPQQSDEDQATLLVALLLQMGANCLMRTFLAMRYADTVLMAQVLLRTMGPLAWEMLTHALEMDVCRRGLKQRNGLSSSTNEEAHGEAQEEALERSLSRFYDELYSCVPADGRQLLTSTMLHRKNELNRRAMKEVLMRELDVDALH
jgi:hypothetical protein